MHALMQRYHAHPNLSMTTEPEEWKINHTRDASNVDDLHVSCLEYILAKQACVAGSVLCCNCTINACWPEFRNMEDELN